MVGSDRGDGGQWRDHLDEALLMHVIAVVPQLASGRKIQGVGEGVKGLANGQWTGGVGL